MTFMISVIASLFCIFFLAAITFTATFLRSRKIKRINLLANINQKVFMTFWLGSFFAGLFVFLNFFARFSLGKDFFLSAFTYGMGNPEIFFYLGGVLFVSTTLLVYLVRIAGKRFYCRMKRIDR